jgi:hypothetical protein
LATGVFVCRSFGAEVLPLAVPPPVFADSETAAHVAVPPLDGRHFFKISMDFCASQSNCLTAAVGQDADGDGTLSLREQTLEVGWDGAWFIRRKGASAWERREQAGAEGRRLFVASQWLHRARAEQRLTLSVDGVPLAIGGGAEAWLPLAALEGGLVRVTARGCGAEGTAEWITGVDGSVLKLK